jgi:hypothetical protein
MLMKWKIKRMAGARFKKTGEEVTLGDKKKAWHLGKGSTIKRREI